MRAVGYVRISKESPDTTSPRRQREAIAQLCEARGWDLVETHEDVDISAYNGKHRPAFDTLMSHLVDVDAVVFWRLDRLARSVRQLEDIADACQQAKVQLVSTDGEVDTTSAAGRAFYQMRGVFGEFESRNLSERSRQMTAHKKARGEWIGRVPYGWQVVDKHLEPDPDQQAVLEQAARRYAAGKTFTSIARDLGFQVGPLSRMLHSERVQAALPDDLSGDLARALVERRAERVPTSRQSLLGGIPTCGVCGGPVNQSSTRAGRNGRWYQYRCKVGGHVGISGPWLDAYVTAAVLEAVDTGKLVKAIKRRQKPTRSRKASEIEARIELLDEMLTAGKVTPARYERMNGQLVEQLASAQADERHVGVDIPVELARNLTERWDGLSIAIRRQIIEAVVERVEVERVTSRGGSVDPSRVRIDWRTD